MKSSCVRCFVLSRQLSRLHPKPFQAPHRALLVITGEMGIPQGHGNILMSHQLFHGWENHFHHDQTARKRVPQIVKGRSGMTAARTACSKAIRKERYGVPLLLQKTKPVTIEVILTPSNVVVNLSFMGIPGRPTGETDKGSQGSRAFTSRLHRLGGTVPCRSVFAGAG